MAVLHSLDYEVVGCASLRPPCGRWISGQRSQKVVKDGSEKLEAWSNAMVLEVRLHHQQYQGTKLQT
jgi:hypothetical protein